MCEHHIFICLVCGDEYDVDYSPPLDCHDEWGDWDIRIENREECRIHRRKND